MPEVEIEDETAAETSSRESPDSQKVFLNPTTRHTLLTDLVNGSYNTDVINNGNKGSGGSSSSKGATTNKVAVSVGDTQQTTKPNSMTVATRDGCNRLNSV